MTPHPLAPVVAVDIDGTMGDYHNHLARFAEMWTGREVVYNPDPDEPFDLHKILKMSKASYRQMKTAFRAGGMKRSMPVYPGAAEFTKGVRRMGYKVWICTTRPYQKFDNIDPDTREWLKRHGIQWDHILYGDEKYKDLVRIVGQEQILAVFDDLPDQMRRLQKLEIPEVFIRKAPHNSYWLKVEGNLWQPRVVESCYDMYEAVRQIHEERKARGIRTPKG